MRYTLVCYPHIGCGNSVARQECTRTSRPYVEGVDPGIPSPSAVLASNPPPGEHDIEVGLVNGIKTTVFAQFGSAPSRNSILCCPEAEERFRQALALEQLAS